MEVEMWECGGGGGGCGVCAVGGGGELRRRDGRGCWLLTFVLRSTHSSQLSVGLLRFCFFLAGAWPWVADEAAGLVEEGCEVPSELVMLMLMLPSLSSRFIVRHGRRGPRAGSNNWQSDAGVDVGVVCEWATRRTGIR